MAFLALSAMTIFLRTYSHIAINSRYDQPLRLYHLHYTFNVVNSLIVVI